MSDGECHISKKGDCECQHNLQMKYIFYCLYEGEKANVQQFWSLLCTADMALWYFYMEDLPYALLTAVRLQTWYPKYVYLNNKQTNKWMKTKNFQMLLIATNLPICECIEPSTIGTPICTADSCKAATDFANLMFEDQMLLSWKRKETVIFKDWSWNENILSVDL